MRKFLFLALLLTMALASCQEKNNKVSTDDSQSKIDSLQRVIAQKDNEVDDMLSTFNEIQEGLRQISETEEKLSVVSNGEGTDKTEQIKQNMLKISQQMKRNRELVAKLRQQLRTSTVQSEKLRETIDNLVLQLDEKDKELQDLRAQLADKDTHIAELDNTVNSLNANVSSLTEEGNRKSQTISQQDRQLNTAWYVFGTKSELKAQHILEKGKVLRSNFNRSYFTKVDIRTDREIHLYSKSAKMLTNHPTGSYTLTRDANKQYNLRINNPEAFWSTSRYLVILVK